MLYTGKLFHLKKMILGVYCLKKTRVENIQVKPGLYLVLYGFIDRLSNNIFLEILCDKKIVLLRIKNLQEKGILY
jgi:hypothetical protein